MTMKHLMLVAALAGVLSCNRRFDPDGYLLAPANTAALDAILTLTATPSSISADGISTMVVTTQIDPNAEKRQVNFSTSDGTFTIGAQSDVKKAIVAADLTGRAVTELRSSLTAQTVRIDASIEVGGGSVVRRSLDVSFAVPSPNAVLALTAGATTLPADGFSRVAITGQLLASGGSAEQRRITFTSSEGTLFAAGQTANVTLTVPVDADGNARVELQSTKNLRNAEVTASVAGVTRSVVIQQIAVNPSSIITVSAVSTAPADGASLTSVTALVAAAVPEGRRTVTFTASPSSVTLSRTSGIADGSNQVTTDISSPSSTGPVRVTATVDGTSAAATVLFVPALPDRILATAASPTVAPSGSVQITATLQRDIGRVTAGTEVLFAATDASGAAVGSFAQNSVSNSSGEATAVFFPGGATGPITITARVSGATAVANVRIVSQ